MLAGAYFANTHDLDFIRSIWPSIDLALEWIDRYGDKDGDGFIEYARLSAKGIDSTRLERFLGLGLPQRRQLSLARPSLFAKFKATLMPPSAPARRSSLALGQVEKSEALLVHAAQLKEQFSQAILECKSFRLMPWLSMVRNGNARSKPRTPVNACIPASSTKGTPAKSRHSLMAADSFSGWGVRTLAVIGSPLQSDGLS